jgi:hypothetical protein
MGRAVIPIGENPAPKSAVGLDQVTIVQKIRESSVPFARCHCAA